MRARSADQRDRIGSLLVNPGGPGGSGVDLAVYLTPGLPESPRRFDIVGFDPRGVGRSDPVKCIVRRRPRRELRLPTPTRSAQATFDEVVALNQAHGRRLRRKYGDELPLVLHRAGRPRHGRDPRRRSATRSSTYLGYSYGTLLGAVYAQLFPDKIRALVLDGAVDPQPTRSSARESQAKGFERAFDNFAAWCDDNASRCPIDGDAAGAIVSS